MRELEGVRTVEQPGEIKCSKPPQILVNIQPWYFREAELLYQGEKSVQGNSIQNLNNKACEEGEEDHQQTLPVRVIKHYQGQDDQDPQQRQGGRGGARVAASLYLKINKYQH